jgi:hypothetical protein
VESGLKDRELFNAYKNLSKTRWSARVESIQAIWTSFDVIVDVLQQITNNADQQTQMQAVGLRKLNAFP